MQTTAVCTAMARTLTMPQLKMLAILWCFDLTRGKKKKKITKLALTLTYTNCQLVSNRETDHKSMISNQLQNRNNLATWKSINHQTKFKKSLDLSLRARDKFCH